MFRKVFSVVHVEENFFNVEYESNVAVQPVSRNQHTHILNERCSDEMDFYSSFSVLNTKVNKNVDRIHHIVLVISNVRINNVVLINNKYDMIVVMIVDVTYKSHIILIRDHHDISTVEI